MTGAETIAIGVTVALFAGLLGMIIGGKDKVDRKEFESHKASSIPHAACPVHDEKFRNVENKLTSIEKKVDELLER